ncbi:MAG: cytidine deaminase [Elusimicrobia bacterium]|nr:cytidine deaminase [Elusimicrobiota bacterium]
MKKPAALLKPEKNYLRLMRLAKDVAVNSYSPYSKFSVGAAVLAISGKIYTGANIENVSYGLSMCAERVAIFKAISAGEKRINAVAVWTKGGNAFPCGACRQVIAEFAPNAEIVINTPKDISVFDTETLLPKVFKKNCC